MCATAHVMFSGLCRAYLGILDLLRVGGRARGLQDAVELYVGSLDQLWVGGETGNQTTTTHTPNMVNRFFFFLFFIFSLL